MSNSSMIEEAARRLREANENKVVCQPIRDLLGESNLAAAVRRRARQDIGRLRAPRRAPESPRTAR